jgi:hypothetical protein
MQTDWQQVPGKSTHAIWHMYTTHHHNALCTSMEKQLLGHTAHTCDMHIHLMMLGNTC